MVQAVQEQTRFVTVTAPSVTGELRLHEFRSRTLGNTRLLRVWLPPDYESQENNYKTYPVLYLNDGQNLFEASTSFTGVEWQVDETADRLIREGRVPPMIIVGIDNARDRRIREFVPYRSFGPRVLRPQGDRYVDFLTREVLPFINKNYRTARGQENTGIGGSSLGGLISLYATMVQPGVFGRLLVESPSLFMANRRILKESRQFWQWPARIFLGIGTSELGDERRSQVIVEDVLELEQILRRGGVTEDRLRVRVEEGAVHNEADWAHRFPEALEFLFG